MEYGAICTPFIFVVYAKSKYLCVLISNEMGKNKLEKFADMASYPHVFEYPYSAVDNVPFDMKGKWHQEFFGNDHLKRLERASDTVICRGVPFIA